MAAPPPLGQLQGPLPGTLHRTWPGKARSARSTCKDAMRSTILSGLHPTAELPAGKLRTHSLRRLPGVKLSLPSGASADSPAQEPTSQRYRVMVLLCTLSFLTYFDRVCIVRAQPLIQKEL